MDRFQKLCPTTPNNTQQDADGYDATCNITSHEERVNEILLQAAEFVEADHFEKDEIEDRAKAVAERY